MGQQGCVLMKDCCQCDSSLGNSSIVVTPLESREAEEPCFKGSAFTDERTEGCDKMLSVSHKLVDNHLLDSQQGVNDTCNSSNPDGHGQRRRSRSSMLPMPSEGHLGSLMLHLHSASFSRFREASVFAVVSVAGKQLGRTESATLENRKAVWDFLYSHESQEMPSEISVSVWGRNHQGHNVLQGSVTIPCFQDMHDLIGVDFALSNKSRKIGVIHLTLQIASSKERAITDVSVASQNSGSSYSKPASDKPPSWRRGSSFESNFSSASMATNTSIGTVGGLEVSYVLAGTLGSNWVKGAVSLAEPEGDFEEANKALANQLRAEAPVHMWEVKADEGWLPWEPGVEISAAAGRQINFVAHSEQYKAIFHSETTGFQIHMTTGKRRELRAVCKVNGHESIAGEMVHVKTDQSMGVEGSMHALSTLYSINDAEHEAGLATIQSINDVSTPEFLPESRSATVDQRDSASIAVLLGSWKCVATTGLEDFLKSQGVGVFQRKMALAARWPTWDFIAEDSSKAVKFINHSAVGDLKELMLLDGTEYNIKDGHGNPLACSSSWQPAIGGGILKTIRSGAMGSYTEERCVDGDTLEFVLKQSDDSLSWGRSFVRKDSKKT